MRLTRIGKIDKEILDVLGGITVQLDSPDGMFNRLILIVLHQILVCQQQMGFRNILIQGQRFLQQFNGVNVFIAYMGQYHLLNIEFGNRFKVLFHIVEFSFRLHKFALKRVIFGTKQSDIGIFREILQRVCQGFLAIEHIAGIQKEADDILDVGIVKIGRLTVIHRLFELLRKFFYLLNIILFKGFHALFF